MTHRHIWAYLAAGWAIIFAAPHVYWATGRTAGLGTALSDPAVAAGKPLMMLSIAAFCLCGAAAALATLLSWPARQQRLARRVLLGLAWFGAGLLASRCVAIYLQFNLALTGVTPVSGADHAISCTWAGGSCSSGCRGSRSARSPVPGWPGPTGGASRVVRTA